MDKKVQEYFVDLESRSVDKENNIILLSSKSVKRKRQKDHSNYYIIDNIPVFIKGEDIPQILLSSATSKMYNEIGIATPLICPVKIGRDERNILLALASQDVKPLQELDYEVVKADQTEFFKNYCWRNRNHNIASAWDILDNPKKIEMLQKFMTKECFDQFVSLLLADELRTDNDRHWDNFFFYKKKGAEKFEGIIPIDLENIQYLNYHDKSSKRAFNRFLTNHLYSSYTFEEHLTHKQPYSERMALLRKVISDGKLNSSHIDTIRKELEYELPDAIKALGNKYNFKKKSKHPYEMTARLWDYNRNTIGRDLGM